MMSRNGGVSKRLKQRHVRLQSPKPLIERQDVHCMHPCFPPVPQPQFSLVGCAGVELSLPGPLRIRCPIVTGAVGSVLGRIFREVRSSVARNVQSYQPTSVLIPGLKADAGRRGKKTLTVSVVVRDGG